MLEDAIREELLGQPQIVGLLGTANGQPGVYAVIRPQGSPLPSILISRSSTTRQELFCGTDTLVSADVQIDSYAGDGGCFDLAKLVRSALIGFTGMLGGGSPGVYVSKAFLTNEFPLTDPDPGVIRQTQLYTFWYQEDL